MSEFSEFNAAAGTKLGEVMAGFTSMIEACDPPLDVTWRKQGFELRVAARDDKPAGRPRIFVFRQDEGKVFAFFYKPSRLSFSKDRFSYGLQALHRGAAADVLEILDQGLRFLEADFKPALRPQKLGRTVNITIPRD